MLGRPLRLYLLEVSGMALGLATVVAVGLLILRRATNDRVATVTSVVDWVLLAALLLQVATGVYIAFTLRWGAVWYLHTASPWLWSLVKLNPQVQYLAVLPAVVKVHAVNAFLLVTSSVLRLARLVFRFPIRRPYQVVIWYPTVHQIGPIGHISPMGLFKFDRKSEVNDGVVPTQATVVLTMNTTAFTVCFAVWVMFPIIGIPIKTGLHLSETQFGPLAATPSSPAR
jgi:hypothetical protein